MFQSCRQVFVFIQETIAMLSRRQAETSVKLYLEMSLAADSFAGSLEEKGKDGTEYAHVAFELLSQGYSLYEESVAEARAQQRCIRMMIGTLLSCKALSKQNYDTLTTKTAQFSAKVTNKAEQCQLVCLCAHLFYPTEGENASKYQNAQRALECLQRSLKLADACTSANASNVQLFVDLMEQYVLFFERRNPAITHAYITGLAALIKEHLNNASSFDGESLPVADAKAHFNALMRYIKMKKTDPATAELFTPIQIESIGS